MTKFTIEQKYEFLLSKLKIYAMDLWENDALLNTEKAMYFQFNTSEAPRLEAGDKDFAVEQAMIAEEWNKAHNVQT